MFSVEVEKELIPFTHFGRNALETMRFFGMTLDSLHRRAPRFRLSLTLEAGQICCLTGPSGVGKSVLLNALYEQAPPAQRIRLEEIPLEPDKALIDCIDGHLTHTLPLLSRAGLSDVPTLLLPPAVLSDGQKWRYRLARAMLADKPILFADEFCAVLDTITSQVIAWHLRKIADRTGRIFVLAGCREEVLAELKPDVLVNVSHCGTEILPRR